MAEFKRLKELKDRWSQSDYLADLGLTESEYEEVINGQAEKVFGDALIQAVTDIPSGTTFHWFEQELETFMRRRQRESASSRRLKAGNSS